MIHLFFFLVNKENIEFLSNIILVCQLGFEIEAFLTLELKIID